jgi:hypothetical protein
MFPYFAEWISQLRVTKSNVLLQVMTELTPGQK